MVEYILLSHGLRWVMIIDFHLFCAQSQIHCATIVSFEYVRKNYDYSQYYYSYSYKKKAR